jgi:hypothetical protein
MKGEDYNAYGKIERAKNYYFKKRGGMYFFRFGSVVGGSVYFPNNPLANFDRKAIIFMVGLTTATAIFSLL